MTAQTGLELLTNLPNRLAEYLTGGANRGGGQLLPGTTPALCPTLQGLRISFETLRTN